MNVIWTIPINQNEMFDKLDTDNNGIVDFTEYKKSIEDALSQGLNLTVFDNIFFLRHINFDNFLSYFSLHVCS